MENFEKPKESDSEEELKKLEEKYLESQRLVYKQLEELRKLRAQIAEDLEKARVIGKKELIEEGERLVREISGDIFEGEKLLKEEDEYEVENLLFGLKQEEFDRAYKEYEKDKSEWEEWERKWKEDGRNQNDY